VNNAEAPAFWNLYWLMPYPCGNNTNPQLGPILVQELGNDYGAGNLWEMEVETGALDSPLPNYYSTGLYAELNCYVPPPWLLPASTRFAILGSLPNTLTLTSRAPLITQYGMPLLYMYNSSGTIVATETATNVSGGGTQATFPFPSSLTQSGYSLAVVNQIGGGPGFSPAGDNLLSIASSQTIAGNPFGVAVGDQTDSWEDRDTCDRSESSGSNYSTIPVVSLYSANRVLINGTPVNVGANPTAVATIQGSPVRQNSGDDCDSYRDSYSGATQAIVANSGSNTVSIVDLVNDVLLSNVTVGNQPVALVVSSDGTTAYVANYADSTVTQVNLTSDTPVTSIAVGGQPTSVALTAAGVLWVGGAGFPTEINTSNMSVTATESTSGRTIAGLGFSDLENELIATSTVGSGNVNIDEISPSSVQTGGTYATLASHSISTLGTYFNPRVQTQSFGFTSTPTSSMIPINTAQPGAPPLVVQDGWAVVTATPTGFSITDASGHVVLVSETTPSPVAAIAVDSKLNVAYLTMPDSNTLLTVPLPGTGTN